ncbi:MAG: extracellular solute-binding protein [Acetatifactor sp.]|nr:extracellular solute-binding protein [Acetatifactor sp.]
MLRGKKFLSYLLVTASVLSLTACGGQATDSADAEIKQSETPASGGSEAATDTADGEATASNIGFEPYEEELNIHIGRLASQHTVSTLLPGDTLEDNPYTRYVKEKLNITFTDEIEAGDDDYRNAIALAAASGDVPELFTVTSYDTLVDLVESDLIEDLTDAFDKYASDYIKHNVYDSFDGRCLDMATFGGKLMALPGTNADNGVPTLVWFRKDWLDKLGLNPDEDGDLCVTVEDVERIAKEFVEKDPSGQGTIGIAMSEGPGDAEWIVNAYGGTVGKWLDNGDGTITWSTLSDANKKAWETMNRWFEEGLLDPQFGTRTYGDVTSLLIENKCGIAFGAWHMPDWRFSHVKDANPEAEYAAYAILDVNGKITAAHENPTNHFIVVRKGYEHPEAAVKIQNVIFDELANATMETAPEVMQFVMNGGDNFTKPVQIECLPSNTKEVYYTEHQAVLKGEITPDQTSTAENKNSSSIMMEYLKDPENVTEETRTGWSFYNSRITGLGAAIGAVEKNNNMNWISPLYPPTLDEMEQKKGALDTVEAKAYIKIITGEEPIDYFETYKDEWMSYGGSDIIAEMEEYYANK